MNSDTKTIAIVIDASMSTSFALVLARLFDTVVNVRRSRTVGQLLRDVQDLKPDHVICADELDAGLIVDWMRAARPGSSSSRFVVLGMAGLTPARVEEIELGVIVLGGAVSTWAA